ncbi:hypothetical protein RhiirB3_522708 [Rhizophagus irregularis]|nr:hypothetical protein RhiirB3_522708 [Rhizophagus irregularis]
MTQTNEETCEELIEVDTKLYLKDDILELKKVDEYIEYEKKTLGLNAFSKPGKTPIRLNKRETKVSSVYYFIVLFMAKWSGEVLKKIIENIFRENFTAHGSKDLQDRISELEADVTARDLKWDQRTQEADVTAKERIILEKTEENNRIRGKFKAQGSNGKSVANTVMEYWSDMEIYERLRNNVGLIKSMRIKRCYKYKTVRCHIHFSNSYEQIYKDGGVNVSITKNNRKFFFRMFDSRLTYHQMRNKFCWQASKRIADDNSKVDSLIIKEYVNKYTAFFGKIVRVCKARHIILYFKGENALRNATGGSWRCEDYGIGLQVKEQDDFIN